MVLFLDITNKIINTTSIVVMLVVPYLLPVALSPLFGTIWVQFNLCIVDIESVIRDNENLHHLELHECCQLSLSCSLITLLHEEAISCYEHHPHSGRNSYQTTHHLHLHKDCVWKHQTQQVELKNMKYHISYEHHLPLR